MTPHCTVGHVLHEFQYLLVVLCKRLCLCSWGGCIGLRYVNHDRKYGQMAKI